MTNAEILEKIEEHTKAFIEEVIVDQGENDAQSAEWNEGFRTGVQAFAVSLYAVFAP